MYSMVCNKHLRNHSHWPRYFLSVRTNAITSSTWPPVTLATGFILPLPLVITAFRPASGNACTALELSAGISTFIILAMVGLPAPSAPWQDLQALSKTALPSSAPAHAEAAPSAARMIQHVERLICVVFSLTSECEKLFLFL